MPANIKEIPKLQVCLQKWINKDFDNTLQDFGMVIPASQQSKLVTRFFRAIIDNTNTFPGLGLGLYISKEIIKCHPGTMCFTSVVGEGSVFCLSILMQIN